MGILDFIKNLFNNNKKNATIYTTILKKPVGDKTPLEVALYDEKTPITDEEIGIEVNGKQYIRTTDKEGVATLNINLGAGKYKANIYWRGNKEYNKTSAYCEIIITTDTYIDGINLTKNEGDTTPYQCAVYRKDTNARIYENVDITINNKTYNRTADNEGLYKLNINLNQGTYPIKAEYKGNNIYNPSTVNNTITINPKPVEPVPQPTPQESRNIKILNYFEDRFGECQYFDDAMEKIQGNGYAFYFSDGYDIWNTIDRMANGDGANCFDSAEVFYHLALGMNEKYGRNYEVQYLDVWCPVNEYDHIRLRLRNGSNGDWWYRDPSACLDGNGITYNWCSDGAILEVNPSWIYDE